MNYIEKSCMCWLRRADAALSKMMDALADLLHVHLRPLWPHKSSLLRDRIVVSKMQCSANDFCPGFSISDAFLWVHVENKSNGLSEHSNRRAAAVVCEEVCCKTPPDTGAYYLDWHRLLQLISADMRGPEQLQEVLYPSHTLINKHQHTHTLVSNSAVRARSPAQWRIAFSKRWAPVSCHTQIHTRVLFQTLLSCVPRQHFQA